MVKHMNLPEETDGRAYTEWRNGEKWVCCPYCGKAQFKITPITKIEHLWYKCKNSKCKSDMVIDIQD